MTTPVRVPGGATKVTDGRRAGVPISVQQEGILERELIWGIVDVLKNRTEATAELPPIDGELPAVLETATFAMG